MGKIFKILLIIFTILFTILNVYYIIDNKYYLDESKNNLRGFYEFNFILKYISIIMNLLFLFFYYMKKITINKFIIYYLVIDNTFNILFYLLHFNINLLIFQFSIYLILLSEYNINSNNVEEFFDEDTRSSVIDQLPITSISTGSVIDKMESEIDNEQEIEIEIVNEPNDWYNEPNDWYNEGEKSYGAYDREGY